VTAASDGGPTDPPTPFRCANYALRNVSGVFLDLRTAHWPGPTDFCAFSGTTAACSFQNLVQLLADARWSYHPRNGMALGISGLRLFIESGVHLSTAPAPVLEVRERRRIRTGKGVRGQAAHCAERDRR